MKNGKRSQEGRPCLTGDSSQDRALELCCREMVLGIKPQ